MELYSLYNIKADTETAVIEKGSRKKISSVFFTAAAMLIIYLCVVC